MNGPFYFGALFGVLPLLALYGVHVHRSAAAAAALGALGGFAATCVPMTLMSAVVLLAGAASMWATPRAPLRVWLIAAAGLWAALLPALPDLETMHPNVRTYPNFHEQLKQAMRTETQMFFEHLVREDRSVLELLTADYSFMNERLARSEL